MRYKIKAIYGSNSVIKGHVEADTAETAILKAERYHLLDGSEDADDLVAVPITKQGSTALPPPLANATRPK